jgi:hypothetical protein
MKRIGTGVSELTKVHVFVHKGTPIFLLQINYSLVEVVSCSFQQPPSSQLPPLAATSSQSQIKKLITAHDLLDGHAAATLGEKRTSADRNGNRYFLFARKGSLARQTQQLTLGVQN